MTRAVRTTSLRTPSKNRSKKLLAATLLVAAAAVVGCSDDAGAESEDAAPPCIGKCDGIANVSGALPVTVHAASWDGRVLLVDDDGECRVLALRPTEIDVTNPSVSFPPTAFSEGLPCPTTLGTPALAMATDEEQNPYPSDAEGTFDWGGDHQTYALTLVEADAGGQLVRRRGTVVVAHPFTAQAEVVTADWDETPAQLGIEGATPSLTADGGLLVFERDGALLYARAQGDAFTTPAPLTALHTEADVLVDGLRLRDRYPLATEFTRSADGARLGPGESLIGARPWISQDGSELVFETEGGTMVLGQQTGFAVRHLDGPINASSGQASAFHVGLGRTGSAWAPFPGTHSLPVRDHRLPTIPLFGFETTDDGVQSRYDEIDFSAFSDEDYVAYLPMNELVAVDGSLEGARAGDISGQFNTAVLEGAAFESGTIPGARGAAAFVDSGGRIVIPDSETTAAPDRGLAVSMFVRPMADGLSGSLAHWPGIADIELGDDGEVTFVVHVDGETRRSTGTVQLERDAWTHLALAYDGIAGILRVYADGRRVAEDRFGRGIATGGGAIVLGEVTAPGGGAVLGVDEVTISRVVRFDEEVFDLATGEVMQRIALGGAELLRDDVAVPLGLDPEEIVMPAWSNVRPATVELGQLIFFDTRLSRNGAVSCATCHDPELAFTDGRATGPHIDGGDLTRATPTIFNRGLSMAQFWDSRSPSLESQALSPIGSPAEMNFTIPEAVALMESSPEYVDRFMDVFGRAPSAAGIANALAAFQRSQMAGDSPVDRFEAGEVDALTESERRGRVLFAGKARCISCHGGSNYSDEQLHDVGLLDDRDFGAFFTRRGRTRNLRAFKTPTLRNIDVTGPYFHNGSVETLEEVVALYSDGPQQPGADPESRPLNLTADEQTDLVAFLRALNSPNAVQTFDIDLPEVE